MVMFAFLMIVRAMTTTKTPLTAPVLGVALHGRSAHSSLLSSLIYPKRAVKVKCHGFRIWIRGNGGRFTACSSWSAK